MSWLILLLLLLANPLPGRTLPPLILCVFYENKICIEDVLMSIYKMFDTYMYVQCITSTSYVTKIHLHIFFICC